MKDIRVLRQWYMKIIDGGKDLSAWEVDFLVHICAKMAAGANITEREEYKLEEIYANKTK